MTGSDTALEGPVDTPCGTGSRWRPPMPLTTRLLIRVDIAAHRNVPLFLLAVAITLIALAVACVVVVLLVARINLGIAILWWLAGSFGLSGLTLWINARQSHRTCVRAALPSEVVALRRYSLANTWTYVQDAAADWTCRRPRSPVTIAMILRWQDEAAAKLRAAVPPTTVEQAAARAQAQAFE